LGDADIALARALARAQPQTSPLVLAAAALTSAATQLGHSCLPLPELDPQGAGTFAARAHALGVADRRTLEAALRESPWLARDADGPGVLVLHDERLYLRRNYDYERELATCLATRAASVEVEGAPPTLDLTQADDDQREATRIAVQGRLLVLCGGPGSGKTWTLSRIVAMLAQQGTEAPRVVLAAPTGKAAARLAESVRELTAQLPADLAARMPHEASTLHRLLNMRPQQVAAGRDPDHPLNLDALVVDECSMVDLPMMTKLLRAVPPHARLVLCGDPDQLPAIEGGAVFSAMADVHNRTPWQNNVVRLRGARRFGAQTALNDLVQAVRAGNVEDVLAVLRGGHESVRWHDAALGSTDVPHLAQGYGAFARASEPGAALHALAEYRVLCALREGRAGAQQVHAQIERALFGAMPAARREAFVLAANAPALNLFNGDTGVIWPAFADAMHVNEAWFDMAHSTLQSQPVSRLPARVGALAMTVHRAQGSEFQRVALVLPPAPHALISRQWLYTAVSRARIELEIYAPWNVLLAALQHNEPRYGGLATHVS
jgi:exodeoxyribonuclease V alpha subunit